MTIKEFYQWSKENNIENYDIKIYDNAYGWYYPQSECLTVNNGMKEVHIGGRLRNCMSGQLKMA